jgi:hypothetical protein
MEVARILLENPSTLLPSIIMDAFSANVISSHPIAMPMFPNALIYRRPHRSIARPPRRQPKGLAIAYTLAGTYTIQSRLSDIPFYPTFDYTTFRFIRRAMSEQTKLIEGVILRG